MRNILIVFPPWICSTTVTLLGMWGEVRWSRPLGQHPVDSFLSRVRQEYRSILLVNLVFLSLLPISVLSAIGPMLPFSGPQAGLAVAMAAFVFGSIPVRLHERDRLGWDATLWWILIDLVRIGGALALVGWLCVP